MSETASGAGLRALRADLLAGDLSSLDAHLVATETLAEELAARGLNEADLRVIRREAERNRDLLASAAAGVRAALRRLGEAAGPAAVYAADGSKLDLDRPRPSRETRA